MARASTSGSPPEDVAGEPVEHRVLGARLRMERQKRNLSLRELARRINVSASLVSQIENGRVRPSVSTLMALVTELELSLDNLFSPSATSADDVSGGNGATGNGSNGAGVRGRRTGSGSDDSASHEVSGAPIGPLHAFQLAGLLPFTGATTWSKAQAPPLFAAPWSALGVERPGGRAFLELESGVRWERLTPYSVPGMEFLYVHYEAGASSTAAGKHSRHEGIEFGYITNGTLHITVGFDEIVCDPGSSVMFDAATPHRLENRADVPAEAVWLIIGRQSFALGAAPDANS